MSVKTDLIQNAWRMYCKAKGVSGWASQTWGRLAFSTETAVFIDRFEKCWGYLPNATTVATWFSTPGRRLPEEMGRSSPAR